MDKCDRTADPGSKDTGYIYVIYPYLPHYRAGVFTELERQAPHSVRFIAGPSSRDGSVPVIRDGLRSVEIVRNRWLGPALWQSGLLRRVLTRRIRVAIFLGDASHLTTWLAAGVLRLRGVPVYFWTIGWHRPDRSVKRLVRVLFYRLANGLLLYGNTARKIGREMGYPIARTAVIGNSHDMHSADSVGEISAERLATHLPEGEIVGAVIRLNQHKRLDLLIDAVALIRETGRNVTVLLAGAGPEIGKLTAQAQRLGVPLYTPGAVYSPKTLEAVYAALRVTVVPVAVGLTAIQSLSHGTPVVTCDDAYSQMPEYEAIIPGRTGSLYATGSTTDLADKIVYWLDAVASRPQDVATDCKREVADNWSSRVHARRIVSAIEQ